MQDVSENICLIGLNMKWLWLFDVRDAGLFDVRDAGQ